MEHASGKASDYCRQPMRNIAYVAQQFVPEAGGQVSPLTPNLPPPRDDSHSTLPQAAPVLKVLIFETLRTT